jgi:hypothetical protein
MAKLGWVIYVWNPSTIGAVLGGFGHPVIQSEFKASLVYVVKYCFKKFKDKKNKKWRSIS